MSYLLHLLQILLSLHSTRTQRCCCGCAATVRSSSSCRRSLTHLLHPHFVRILCCLCVGGPLLCPVVLKCAPLQWVLLGVGGDVRACVASPRQGAVFGRRKRKGRYFRDSALHGRSASCLVNGCRIVACFPLHFCQPQILVRWRADGDTLCSSCACACACGWLRRCMCRRRHLVHFRRRSPMRTE